MAEHEHDHTHGAGLLSAGGRYRDRLVAAFVILAVFFVVEVVTGILANSLALLSDAGHMLTDLLGIGMALAAISLAARHEGRDRHEGDAFSRHTFGLYRLEILAAFVNALLLLGVALYVVIEAVRRLGGEADVAEGPMLVVAVLGLLVNLAVFLSLRAGARESLNLEGAALEVLADLIGSIGVVAAAIMIRITGWSWVDPVFGAVIGLWILPRAVRLGVRAARILVQSAPPHVDLDHLFSDLSALPGVVDVHDLHVWTLTSGMDAVSAHLMTGDGADQHAVLDQALALVGEHYAITHATFQVEPDTHQRCADVPW